MNVHDYETSDLGVATALSCIGFKLIALDKKNPRRVVMYFQMDDGLADAVTAYWTDGLRLSPRQVLMHQKLLKERIYSPHA